MKLLRYYPGWFGMGGGPAVSACAYRELATKVQLIFGFPAIRSLQKSPTRPPWGIRLRAAFSIPNPSLFGIT